MKRPTRAKDGSQPPSWVHTSIYLRPGVHRRLRIYAATVGRSLADVVRELVERFLHATEGRKRPS